MSNITTLIDGFIFLKPYSVAHNDFPLTDLPTNFLENTSVCVFFRHCVDSCFYFKSKNVATLMQKNKTKTVITATCLTYESCVQIHSNYRPSLWEKRMVTICNTMIKASVTSLLIFFNVTVMYMICLISTLILRKAKMDIMSS